MKHGSKKAAAKRPPAPAVPEPPPAALPPEHRRSRLLFVAGLIALSLLIFHQVLAPGQILLTTDDNLGAMAARKAALPHGFLNTWDNTVLVGIGNLVPLSWTNLLLYALPLRLFMNWIHAVNLVLASLFFALFLRRRGVGWGGIAVGVLVAFWLGSTFTLTYAGHLGKFGVVMFAALSLWLIERSVQEASWPDAVLAGGALGAMFLEQADVALFFAMALGAYAAYAYVRSLRGGPVVRLAVALVLMAISFGLVSYRAVLGAFNVAGGLAVVGEGDSPSAKWDYATQWSWPPEESIDFIAMGYMGWRSGEPDGPYWGRMGRSAGWEEGKAGFRNFKLENQYLGVIPLLLALWGVFAAFAMLKKGDRWRGEIILWGIVVAATLLLAFGKHFFLYRLFYALPFVSSIRNPNKFLQVFQFAVGILAACGFDLLMRKPEPGRPAEEDKWGRLFLRAVLAVGGVLVLATLVTLLDWDAFVRRMSVSGWAAAAQVIWQNRFTGLIYGTLAAFGFAAFLWLKDRKWKHAGALVAVYWLPAAMMAADVLVLSRHYIRTMPRSFVDRNEVVDVLSRTDPGQRATILVQDSFYGNWLTFLFPYHHLEMFNTIWSRLPRDYQLYFDKLQPTPDRLWQLAAVSKFLVPAQVIGQFNRTPELKDAFDVIFAYNVAGTPDGGVQVIPSSQTQPGQHAILRSKKACPRYSLIGNWEEADEEAALNRLASRDFPLFSRALISAKDLSGLPPKGEDGFAGEISIEDRRPYQMVIRTSAARPAILRISELYDAGWKAWVDGKPVPVFRCDFLFMGVPVGAGLHRVELKYSLPKLDFMIQVAGMAFCGVALAALLKSRCRAGP